MSEYNDYNDNNDKQLLLSDNEVPDLNIKYDHNCKDKYDLNGWPPEWMRKLARPEIFLINFSLVAIFQGAIFTYIIGSLSTLEKRYSFDSKISGFILISDNISQILVSPLIGWLGNRYNRPRLMALGELIAAMSCFVFSAPYFIYGPPLYLQHSNTSNSSYELCTDYERIEECNTTTLWSAVAILWFANFLNGIGYSAFYTVGVPYIDDNTSKKDSPVYLSASAALRLFGPSLGLLMSSVFLKYYERPNIEFNIPHSDPRWVGCWWLGFIVIGVCLMIFSIPLSLFPERMANKSKISYKKCGNESIKSQIVGAFTAIERLLKNPIFMFHIIGIAFKLIGYLGYYIFKPKYIETQFRKSASSANFWTGITITPTMALGITCSGIVMSKMKPKARSVAIYVFFIEIFISICILYAKTIQCPVPTFPQTDIINGQYELTNGCNTGCHCSTKVFQPICADNKIDNYFSPCYAGCAHEMSDTKGDKRTFSNCKCDHSGGQASNGYCPNDCNKFNAYIILFSIVGIISSTGKIGDTLITLRCVAPQDKNFAIGITGAFLAIFAFIPYPLIFGAITDSACMVWEKTCGKSGNCWLYDIERFTNYLHNSSFGFLAMGAFCHLLVIFYANRIPNMFEDEDIDSSEMSLIERKGTEEKHF